MEFAGKGKQRDGRFEKAQRKGIGKNWEMRTWGWGSSEIQGNMSLRVLWRLRQYRRLVFSFGILLAFLGYYRMRGIAGVTLGVNNLCIKTVVRAWTWWELDLCMWNTSKVPPMGRGSHPWIQTHKPNHHLCKPTGCNSPDGPGSVT